MDAARGNKQRCLAVRRRSTGWRREAREPWRLLVPRSSVDSSDQAWTAGEIIRQHGLYPGRRVHHLLVFQKRRMETSHCRHSSPSEQANEKSSLLSLQRAEWILTSTRWKGLCKAPRKLQEAAWGKHDGSSSGSHRRLFWEVLLRGPCGQRVS